MLKRTFNQRAKHDFQIREENGRYRSATEDETIETALSIIDALFVKGTEVCQPKDAHEFLKLEL